MFSGLGPNDARDFSERLLAQPLSNLGQRSPITVSKLQSALELIAQNTILRHEILVAQ